MSSKQIQHFFNNVMMCENIHGWTLNFTTDYYCWKSRKRIDVDPNYDGDVRQMILHEIAHINTCKYSNNKHTPDFWKRMELLTKKYLHTGLDETNLKHKQYMSNGIYSLKYK